MSRGILGLVVAAGPEEDEAGDETNGDGEERCRLRSVLFCFSMPFPLQLIPSIYGDASIPSRQGRPKATRPSVYMCSRDTTVLHSVDEWYSLRFLM